VEIKLNETHQLLICDDNVNLLGDNVNNLKKNTGTQTDAGKEVWCRNKRRES
jgi:hypothetical protein